MANTYIKYIVGPEEEVLKEPLKAGNLILAGKENKKDGNIYYDIDEQNRMKIGGGIGEKTNNGGEIFNDYENNKALSQYSTAIGKENNSGTKCFTITAWNKDAKTYTLDSVEGLSVGDKLSIEWKESYSNCSAITAIDTTNNIITVDTFVIGSNTSDSTEKKLFTHEKPWLGTASYGYGSSAEGAQNTSLMTCSHTEGRGNKALGFYSHTEGRNTTAHYAAHAEGYGTYAKGDKSHAEGVSTQALGHHSHAEGNLTIAEGENSHSEGLQTHAKGECSHAEGSNTCAEGHVSHAEGDGSKALGEKSHAEGEYTKAHKFASHSEGAYSEAQGECSHAEGKSSIAEGDHSHTEGYETKAQGNNSHAEGYATLAEKNCTHAEGASTQATGDTSHAEGNGTVASGDTSHAEGNGTVASGSTSHAEGVSTQALGHNSHAEGNGCEAGNTSHAEGYQCKALPNTWVAHAEGHSTEATGDYSHSEGKDTKASGECAHAEGYLTEASGKYSHAGGIGARATYDAQTAIGKYNANKADTLFEIGNGTYEEQSNAFEVYKDGHVEVQSQTKADGTIPDNAVVIKGYADKNYAKNQLTNTSAPDGNTYIGTPGLFLYDGGNVGGLFKSTAGGNVPKAIRIAKARYNDIDNRTPSDYFDNGINGRNNCCPITPANADYTVKSVLTNPKLEWTDNEKMSACNTIGAATKDNFFKHLIGITVSASTSLLVNQLNVSPLEAGNIYELEFIEDIYDPTNEDINYYISPGDYNNEELLIFVEPTQGKKALDISVANNNIPIFFDGSGYAKIPAGTTEDIWVYDRGTPKEYQNISSIKIYKIKRTYSFTESTLLANTTVNVYNSYDQTNDLKYFFIENPNQVISDYSQGNLCTGFANIINKLITLG